LREPDSVVPQDDKTLCDEEERRLFYVAMTRARDSLTIYAKRGTGKDFTPPGYLRDLLKDATLRPVLRHRAARAFQTDLFAQAAPVSATGLAQWVALPPASDLSARLSASALQSYETCPLRFKLEREWKIPGEVPAAMQYGGSIHRVLRAFYDSVRFGRTLTDEALLELFRSDLREAKIADPYQHQLYETQGIAQLTQFLTAYRRTSAPDVLHTEEFFEIKIGDATVVGRIDRMDQVKAGEIAITDYKTGKPQTQEDADDSLQLSVYALAAAEKWHYRAEHLAFHNLEDNSRALTHRSDTQLEEARLKIEELAGKIAAGNFDAKPGFHCRFCAYHSLCPATEKKLSNSTSPS